MREAPLKQLWSVLLTFHRAFQKMYNKSKLKHVAVLADHVKVVPQPQPPHRQPLATPLPQQQAAMTATNPSISSKPRPRPAAQVVQLEVLVDLAEQQAERISQVSVPEWAQQPEQVLKVELP